MSSSLSSSVLSVVVSTKIISVYEYYIMYDQRMRTVQQSIALFASLLLVLLVLLIVIYDCVGVYDEMIIMFGILVNDDVNLLVEFVVTSVSEPICSPQDIFNTIIPSINVQLGDAVDCVI